MVAQRPMAASPVAAVTTPGLGGGAGRPRREVLRSGLQVLGPARSTSAVTGPSVRPEHDDDMTTDRTTAEALTCPGAPRGPSRPRRAREPDRARDRKEGAQLRHPRHRLARRRRRLALVLLAGLLLAGGLAAYFSRSTSGGGDALHHRQPPRSTTTVPTAPPAPEWRVAWGSAMAWGYGTAADATVRELATLALGGSAVRVRLSNVFGNQPLVVGNATVGTDAVGADVVPGSLHQLTFDGKPGVTIPVGGLVYSDPVAMAASPMQVVAVSVFVSDTDLMTVHPCCDTVASYFTANGAGDLTASPSRTGFVASSPWPRLVDAVDVLESSGKGSIVVVGDSITDGYHSSLRWTDVLQQRVDLLPPADRRAIINEGISANTLTSVPGNYALVGGGPPGVSRLARDALDQSGVSEVVLFLGTNDLYFGAGAQEVIAGLQQTITMAHQAGVRIVGVTLLPREAGDEAWSPTQQSYLEQINDWILTSGAFDGVLNFATPVADVYNGACTPTSMFPPYDSGDHLHPNAAGQTAMANSVDDTVLGLPAAPTVPPLVAVTPTPGCAGVLGIPSATASASPPTSSTSTSPT